MRKNVTNQATLPDYFGKLHPKLIPTFVRLSLHEVLLITEKSHNPIRPPLIDIKSSFFYWNLIP